MSSQRQETPISARFLTICAKWPQLDQNHHLTLVKEAAVEASFGCILRLKNAVNDEFLQDLLRKVMNTVFFDGDIKIDMNQEGYTCFILDQLVALARVDAWFLINCCSETYHFVENCTSNMLEPYLDEIISKLLRCLHDRFLEYYMPYLNFVIMKARGESNGLLLSRTISCMTAIWTVIGKDKFSDDTQQVVQLLASTPISNLDIHDPMRIQGLKAWGRLCKCLGHKFQPYMEVAIPCLLQSTRLTLPDVANIEESDERNRMIQIKTEILKEKATACVLLRDCIAELKEGIDLWIDEFQYSNFYQHAEVRIAAALANDKRLLQKSPFEKLCSDIIPSLVEALVKEEVIKISVVMLDSLEDCLEIKRFLSMIMDILDTSILIPEGNEASEQGEKACACLLEDFHETLQGFLVAILRPAFITYGTYVEEFREEALKFCESELLLLFKACNDCEPVVQEVVAHGIGVAAAFGGSIFKSLVGEAISALNANISNPMALHRYYIMAHDVAAMALEKICLFHKA
ncbi:hypothetical protein OIU78_019438 [Salix suchowensis]|nr:hypothetical protein OIU78_019438 [Salix suchowensis]